METYSVFGLTALQTEVLYELERRIVLNDIVSDERHAERKRQWLSEWIESIQLYLTDKLKVSDVQVFNKDNENRLIDIIEQAGDNNVWKYMILLECVLFSGYYSFKKEDVKKYKGLKMVKKAKKEILERIAIQLLNVDVKYISTFEKAFEKSIKRMSNYWLKVGGIAAGVLILAIIAIFTFQYEILAIFAVEGTSGAALISSGLAALGGGAVAVGGGGMAAGTVVFIGGGVLLGAAAGLPSGFVVAAATNSKLVLSQAAKMEVVLKEIVLAIQKDTECFQKILSGLCSQVAELSSEVKKLKLEKEKNKKKIEELSKSVSYLESIIVSARK